MTDSPASKVSIADRVRAAMDRKAIETSLAVDLLAALAPPRETGVQLEANSRRYKWLAGTVLNCDYGDNQRPGEIGWRVDEFLGPVAYGPSIDAAIDAAMAEEERRRGDNAKRLAPTTGAKP